MRDARPASIRWISCSDFFWGTYTESYFPLLNWFIFVAAGRCFGELYTHLTNKKKLYERIVPFTFVMSGAYILAAGLPQQHIFLIATELTGLSWMRLPDAVGCMITVITIIGMCFLLTGGREITFFSRVSANINKYYCVSWGIISTLYWVDMLYPVKENNATFLVLLTAIFLLSMLIIDFYQKHMESSLKDYFGKHKEIWICAVWIAAVGITVISFAVAKDYPNMFNKISKKSPSSTGGG